MTQFCPWALLWPLVACSGGGDGQTGLLPIEPADGDHDGILSDVDCNDDDAAIFPGASERCNGFDDDCNGTVDDGLMQSFYRDLDGDMYGDPAEMAWACAEPQGFVTDATDCNDNDRLTHPGSVEICDLFGVDEDCSGAANEADPTVVDLRTWYVDADEDGFGSAKTVEACFEQRGLASVATDCNDADYDINPGAVEVCDALDKDEDCDGYSDVDDPEGPLGQPLYYVDVDGDDDGDTSDPGQYFCDGVPPGYTTLNTDCDDTEAVINPRAPENCQDLIDNDCNGAVDDCGPIPDIGLDTADTRLEGSASGAYHGSSVAGVRDVNGDGQADFATSGPNYDVGKGAVWLYYGPIASGTFDPDDVADSVIEGVDMAGYFGAVIDQAGDVNADGFDDLIVGQQYYKGGAGYLFLGPIVGDLSSAAADGTWSGESTTDYAGQSVAGGFDSDADGYGDYLVGAFGADDYAGAAYLVYGPGTGANKLGDAVVKFESTTTYGYLGQALTGVTDMDGDGLDEVALGQDSSSSYGGATYLFLGVSLGGDFVAETDADATYTGTAMSEYADVHIARATDFNGDGLGDLMMGAYGADTGGYDTGSIYVIAGEWAPTSGSAESLAQAELYGEVSYQYIGHNEFDGEMDVNADGFSDVVVSSPYSSIGGFFAGASYFVYGPQTGEVSLANARCAMYGTTSYEASGYSVSFIGDQSGDDSPEVLIGAPFGSSYAGNAYVVWGDRL